MKAFLARWPNGDISLVIANSEEDACITLDEVGDLFDENLIPLDDRTAKAVHFKLTDDGTMEFEEVSGSLLRELPKAWPILDAERSKLYQDGISEDGEAWKQRIRDAVSREREREFGCNAEDAANRAFGYGKEGDVAEDDD